MDDVICFGAVLGMEDAQRLAGVLVEKVVAFVAEGVGNDAGPLVQMPDGAVFDVDLALQSRFAGKIVDVALLF